MVRLIFWIRVLVSYFKRGFPLSAVFRGRVVRIGFRNRGLLAYGSLNDYEPKLQEIILSIQEPFQFLDVGANVGVMSLAADLNPYCESKLALEPSDTYVYLRSNLPTNVNSINVALSDLEKTGGIRREKNAARDFIDYSLAPTVATLSTRSLLARLESSELPFFLKVDIEGGERNVDWATWLESKKFKYAAIEVWDLAVFNKIKEIAVSLEYSVKVYNDRFDCEVSGFAEPVNIYITKT